MADEISGYQDVFNLLEDASDLEERIKIIKKTFPDMRLFHLVRKIEGFEAYLLTVQRWPAKDGGVFMVGNKCYSNGQGSLDGYVLGFCTVRRQLEKQMEKQLKVVALAGNGEIVLGEKTTYSTKES